MAVTCPTCGKVFGGTRALGKHYAEEPAHRAGKSVGGSESYRRLVERCRGASLGQVLRVARDMLDEQIEARRKLVRGAKAAAAELVTLERHRSQVAELVARHTEPSRRP